MMNPVRQFDAIVKAVLGIYVYALRDPRTKRVFYVGKGGGSNETTGNSRLFSHFYEADLAAQLAPSRKIQTILDVWKDDANVEWFIIRHGLRDVDEAFSVEAAIIDALTLSKDGAPDNDQIGHGSIEFGLKNEAAIATICALPVNPCRACVVLVVNIGKTLAARGRAHNADDVYECARGAWALGKFPLKERVGFVVALYDAISCGVFKVTAADWEVFSVQAKKSYVRRWSFSSRDSTGGEELMSKNWGFIRDALAGAANFKPAWVVDFDGIGNFEVLLPKRDGKRSCL